MLLSTLRNSLTLRDSAHELRPSSGWSWNISSVQVSVAAAMRAASTIAAAHCDVTNSCHHHHHHHHRHQHHHYQHGACVRAGNIYYRPVPDVRPMAALAEDSANCDGRQIEFSIRIGHLYLKNSITNIILKYLLLEKLLCQFFRSAFRSLIFIFEYNTLLALLLI